MMIRRAAITPSITPTMKPPPMKRLRIAVGNITNAAKIRKPRSTIMSARTRTSPSMTPSMKLKDARATIQGNRLDQNRKNAGESKATPLKKINAAEVASKTNGNHQKRVRNGRRMKGPCQPGWRPTA